MRLLYLSDLHYALKQYDWVAARAEAFDAVIIGGDLLDIASPLDLDVQIVVAGKYLEKMSRTTPVLVCSGNHDLDTRGEDGECRAAWLQEIRGDGLAVDGDAHHLGAALVSLCPWWDGPAARSEMDAMLARHAGEEKDYWIWVHHAPPAGTRVGRDRKGDRGDPHVVELIQEHQPDLVLCGHLHTAPFVADGGWIDQIGETWVINAGRLPGPLPCLAVLDLDERKIDWVSPEDQDSRSLGAA